MKTLNLFLKMQFTSLSPDGQSISLAIVTSDYCNTNDSGIEGVVGGLGSKSFYAEFTDYDINRCDEWVKDNVVSRLNIPPLYHNGTSGWMSNPCFVHADTKKIKEMLTLWLSQFSDYKLNFIVDCGWFTWYKFMGLMGELEELTPRGLLIIPEEKIPEGDIEEVLKNWSMYAPIYFVPKNNKTLYEGVKIGLPKLPANFPPVPVDLNGLIMDRKGFKSVADAFNLDREEYLFNNVAGKDFMDKTFRDELWSEKTRRGGGTNRYNALWDAKVTKAIYEKLK